MLKNLFQNQYPNLWATFLVCAVTLFAGCNQQSFSSPEGYDLTKPQLMQLGKVLNEISGITYNNDNNTLLAVSDSKEKIFEINLERRKLKDYTERVVGSRADLEDLVKVDSFVYLLSSKGIIYQVPAVKHVDTAMVRSFPFSPDAKNDFESLYYDPTINSLIILCKSCASEKQDTHLAFRFDLATKSFEPSVFYTIDEKDLQAKLKGEKEKFLPSAAALHPITKKLYILSSAGNLLIITDRHGQVLEAYNLNPNNFPQAEGIAFAPNGDMYISNEGKYGSRATLQVFPYQTGNKK